MEDKTKTYCSLCGTIFKKNEEPIQLYEGLNGDDESGILDESKPLGLAHEACCIMGTFDGGEIDE